MTNPLTENHISIPEQELAPADPHASGEKNPLPEYFRLVDEAYDASLRVDEFDLDSENPASRLLWQELLLAQRNASVLLVDYCQQRGPEIIAALLKL